MRWMTGATIYVCGCLLVDFIPHFCQPHFRYTGSDPDNHVWNIGWPLAIMIYDPQSGLHIGPFAMVLIPAEFALSVVARIAILIVRMMLRDKKLAS
jgi:hypothetical protein